MKYRTIFHLISSVFDKVGASGILIGAFAVNYYKALRRTDDIDFLIRKEDYAKIREVLETEGYNEDDAREVFARLKGKSLELIDLDFMFVDNTIDAWLKISENPEFIGDIVNVGSGIEIQIGDLAKRISEMIAGTPVIDLNKEVIGSMRLVCNNEKLKQKTGWMPKISFDEGLRKTIEWYKAHSFEEINSGSHLKGLRNGM